MYWISTRAELPMLFMADRVKTELHVSLNYVLANGTEMPFLVPWLNFSSFSGSLRCLWWLHLKTPLWFHIIWWGRIYLLLRHVFIFDLFVCLFIWSQSFTTKNGWGRCLGLPHAGCNPVYSDSQIPNWSELWDGWKDQAAFETCE